MTARQLTMLAAVSAIWGASYLLIKIALDGFSAEMIVFTRVTLAAAILLAVIMLRGDPDRKALAIVRTRPDRVLVQGLISVALPFSLIALGETQISSGLTGILISPGPLFVALLAPFLDRSEQVGRKGGIGLLIGFAGVIVLVGLDAVSTFGEFVCALAVVGAAASYGLGAMYAKLKFAGVSPLIVSFGACLAASVWTAIPAFASLGRTSPDAGEVAAVVCLGVAGTAVAFVLYYSLIAETGAGRASLVGYLIPPIALAYGALLLDEQITVASIVGMVMILCASYWRAASARWKGNRAPKLHAAMIDTHCHLEACDDPVDVLVERAREAGVQRLLAIGMTDESCKGALDAAAAHDQIFVAAGRHPHETTGWSDDDLARLHELAQVDCVRAIGETGLDYKRNYAPRPDQRNAFIAQIALARELGKPLVIHTRFAAEDTLDLLGDLAQGIEVIIHCFSLTDHVGVCIERGYYCSFAGNVTYPKATELHDAVKRIPDELLLVETDAPFLSPQRWRGKPNEPAKVTATAEFIAELRGTSYDSLEAVVERNATRLLSW